MKFQVITPPYEVVEILMTWADECFDHADKHALQGNTELSKKWAKAGFEAEGFAVQYAAANSKNIKIFQK
jgi:hypothetical protein|tara:strand:+ start:64 stop:273 length:210 start_codon:yes stop_codon:yes gene_type:complete